jgi:hypothetical protein
MADRQQTCNSRMRPALGAMTLKTEFFAQIEPPNFGIFNDLLRVAFHQYPAFMNDERAIDELEGFAHVVIRNKHPDAPRGELSNQLAYIDDCNWINPGEGLVEEQKIGLRRERSRDFNAPAFAAR